MIPASPDYKANALANQQQYQYFITSYIPYIKLSANARIYSMPKTCLNGIRFPEIDLTAMCVLLTTLSAAFNNA
jgi:hypothetical protein